MNNSTNTSDTSHQIVATRPDWMSPEQWIDIQEKVLDKLEELVDNAQVTEQKPLMECDERPWCIQPTPEGGVHDGPHGGEVVPLAHANFEADTGFWCWLHEDRDGRERINFGGRWITDSGSETWSYQLPAGHVAALLWALETPAAVKALRATLARLMESEA